MKKFFAVVLMSALFAVGGASAAVAADSTDSGSFSTTKVGNWPY